MNTSENSNLGQVPEDPASRDRLSSDNPISSTLSEVGQSISREGAKLASAAERAAMDQAEKAKAATSSHIHTFTGALKAASDELAKNQSGPAAEIISHAVSGLETFSRSIDEKSSGEMLDAIRRFGRDNPLGFIAGSVLAGFALGRVATTVSTGETAQNDTTTETSGGLEEPS